MTISLTKERDGRSTAVDSFRVFVNTSEIQFLSPLNRTDAGLYSLLMINPADTLMESFRIDVYCKLIGWGYKNIIIISNWEVILLLAPACTQSTEVSIHSVNLAQTLQMLGRDLQLTKLCAC